MAFDAILNNASVNGTSPYPSGSDQLVEGVDTYTGAAWNNAQGNGWAPESTAMAKNVQLALAAEPTSVVFHAPATGLYRVDVYEISTVATSGDMPSITAAYTDAETAGSATVNVIASAIATSAANTVGSGSAIVNVKAGGTVTLAGSGYSATTYNFKARLSYLG